nr:hypothetical protein [Mycoplasmopsis canis]WQQ12342.1 hypothetical protein RRG48_03075 [Mycoplasmopsis canis]
MFFQNITSPLIEVFLLFISLNDNLFNQINMLYNYWFIQLKFPNYGILGKAKFSEFVYNKSLNKNIPKSWITQTLLNNSLSKVVKPGVHRFNYKTYYATANIINNEILDGSIISYEDRESRANMQPIKHSVWFAKMKNSVKHLFITDNMDFMIKNSILSTGFCGLKCNEYSFEYIASFISNPNFEIKKNILSHGATQEAINNEDLSYIKIIVPDNETLLNYHKITKPIFKKINENIILNRKLQEIKETLLPLLINGQVEIDD